MWDAFFEAQDTHVAVWVADARFVLDQLTQWSSNDAVGLLGGRLDLDHVGMFGHSYGGATAAEVCALDPRFKAGIIIDNAFISPVRLQGGRTILTPLMIMLNELHGVDPSGSTGTLSPAPFRYDPTIKIAYDRLQNSGYIVRIAGTRHNTFQDVPLWMAKFLRPGLAPDDLGTIDPVRALSIIDAYTLAFFQKHLTGMGEPLLDGPPPYPEVTFDKR